MTVAPEITTLTGPRFTLADTGRYKLAREMGEGYRISARDLAPADLRVTLELGQDEGGVWARISELDVTAEGGDVQSALRNVVAAARDLLTYLRDEEPQLAPDLQGQSRYVPLLDTKPHGWFKLTKFVA